MDLSIEVDQDDDTHVCLKCHTTIIGLDNYVEHRKNVQCKRLNTHKTSEINIEPLASPGNSEYPLRADDFFSSLELQSSAKLTSSSTTPRASIGAGILTRSKTNAAILASGAATAATVSNRDDKESSWIGGHSLKISGADNQSKLIKAVDSLSGNVQKKEDTRYQYDLLNEYNKEGEVSNDEFEEMDEESEEDEDVPPRSHTGGKWKPRNSPIQWIHHAPEEHHRSTEWRSSSSPPPNHTGGKWKPTLTTSTTNVRDDPEDDEDEIPPPNHTKGKWVPGKRNETVKSSSHNSSIPPTNYTKGKWIPSNAEPRKVTNEVSLLRKSAGTVQYSCGPCNRTLASKFIYDRHLKSDLHKKRMLLETDFEDMEPVQSTSTTTINLRKRKKKPDPIEETVSKRNKRRISNKCDVCHLKVQSHLIGKHLISHYHWRKSKHTPQIATQMVLDNIENITYQSPFQCNLCKFYCNTETGFLRHWQSKMHETMNSKDKNGYFCCTYCEFKSNTSNEMGTHLHSKSHKEVICAINRSVPIVIYKRSRLYCMNCLKEFRYNIELQRHCSKSNCRNVLSNPKCTASNLYQEKYTCQLCSETFRSLISRQRHLKMKHDKMIYLCTKCSIQFTSIEKAKAHRHSSQHRYVSVLKSNKKKLEKKSCTFCPQVFENIFTFKTHLMEKHLELVPRCPQCGMKFALPQEVTSHLRLKNCAFTTKFPIASSKSYKCKKCPYRTESKAEFLFHEALHRGPVSTTKNTEKYKCSLCMKLFRKASLRCHIRLHTSERPYVCDKCNIGFVRKSNLDSHIKNIHVEEGNIPVDGIEINITPLENSDDGEVKQYGSTSHQNSGDREVKQFLCATCGKNFSKRYLLQQHVINMHKKTVPCPKDGCSYRTYSVSALKPHLQSHNNQRTFQCDFCSYAANTQNLLQRHLKIHDNIKSHRCPVCPFRARLSSRLRQHMRLHTGEKPFKCPHCQYTTTGLENLRKHVISTKKHPGKYLYECKFCTVQNIQSTSTTDLNTIKPFQCNFAQELRKHLLEKHSDKFNAYAATSFVSGIYDATPDPEQIDNPQPLKTNMKQQSKPQKSFTTTNSTPTTFQIIKSTPTTKIDVFNDIHCTTIPTETLSSTLYLTSSSTDNQNVITQRHTGSSSTLLASGEIGQEVSHFEIITSGETKDDITYIALPANVNQGWTTIEGKFKWDDSNEESSQAFHGDDVFIQEVETFHEDVPVDKQE